MLNLDRLLHDITPSESPAELSTADSRLSEISERVIGGEYLLAAQDVDALHEEGIYDARLVGYHLYGAYLERGIAGLQDVLRAAGKSITDNRAAFTPVRKREMFLDGSLHWLFATMARQFERGEQLRDENWKRWMEPAGLAFLQGARLSHEALQKQLTALVPRSRAMPPYLHLGELLNRWTSFHSTSAASSPASERTGAGLTEEQTQSSTRTLAATKDKGAEPARSEAAAAPAAEGDAGSSGDSDDTGAREEEADADAGGEGTREEPEEEASRAPRRAQYARAVSSPDLTKPRAPREEEDDADDEEDDDDDDADDTSREESRGRVDDAEPDDDADDDADADAAPRPRAKRSREAGRRPAKRSAEARQHTATDDGAGDGVRVRGSAALALLLRKIALFSELAASEEFLKASVVALDVQRTLASFDPRVYLPELCAPFFTALVTHADDVEAQSKGQGSLRFQALEQLYRSDLDAFVRAGNKD